MISCKLFFDIIAFHNKSFFPKKGWIQYAQTRLTDAASPCERVIFLHGISKREIVRQEHVSRNFVIAWTKSPDQDMNADARGCKKHRLRSYTLQDEKRVLLIHEHLDENAQTYFSFRISHSPNISKAISSRKKNWRCVLLVARWQTMVCLQNQKCASKEPVAICTTRQRWYNTLGKAFWRSILSARSSSRTGHNRWTSSAFRSQNRANSSIFSVLSLRRLLRLSLTVRDSSDPFQKPEVIKVDNGFAFAGAGPHPRTLNAFTLFLLKNKIIPVFTAPCKPWNQASIEGANSIFSRKFWHRERYTSLEMIDTRLSWFNKSYQQYLPIQRAISYAAKKDAVCSHGIFHS